MSFYCNIETPVSAGECERVYGKVAINEYEVSCYFTKYHKARILAFINIIIASDNIEANMNLRVSCPSKVKLHIAISQHRLLLWVYCKGTHNKIEISCYDTKLTEELTASIINGFMSVVAEIDKLQ